MFPRRVRLDRITCILGFGFTFPYGKIIPEPILSIKYKEKHALSISGTLHFYRKISQRLPEGEALDQQGLVPGNKEFLIREGYSVG
jgi:hypothetical protein